VMKLEAKPGDRGFADVNDISGLREYEVVRKGGRFLIESFDADAGVLVIKPI